METIQIKTKAIADKGIGYLNEVVLNIKNRTNTVASSIFNIATTNGDTDINLIKESGITLYRANNSTDINLSGKTEITVIPKNQSSFFLLVVANPNLESDVIMTSTGTTVVRTIDNNGATAQSNSFISNFKSVPMLPENTFFRIRTTPLNGELYKTTVSELVNSDVVVNMFNMMSFTEVSGVFDAEVSSHISGEGKPTFYAQWTVKDFVITDLALLPANVDYVNLSPLAGSVNSANCSSPNIPMLQTNSTTAKVFDVMIPMNSSSIDNAIIACANRPNKNYVSNRIRFKGTRSSASDSAVATLQAAGITVSVTP